MFPGVPSVPKLENRNMNAMIAAKLIKQNGHLPLLVEFPFFSKMKVISWAHILVEYFHGNSSCALKSDFF